MPKNLLGGSLPIRAGIAVTLIAVFALASAISSGFIARLSEGDAAAINVAGYLRTAIYQMGWKLDSGQTPEQLQQLSQQFEERLASPVLTQAVRRSDELGIAYQALRQRWSTERLETVIEEIRGGLTSAYRQLRELITTFRLSIQEGGLQQALEDTTREFAERGDFQVQLEVQPLALDLSANEQIQLLQVAREALSNCARHAHADQALVTLRQDGEQVELRVEDNGRGLGGTYDQRQHHGLNIMQERARSLDGTLTVSAIEPHGTRVLLRFRPELLSHSTHESPT